MTGPTDIKLALHLAALAAATAAPRILTEASAAANGPEGERYTHIRQAVAHTALLLDRLQTVKGELEQQAVQASIAAGTSSQEAATS